MGRCFCIQILSGTTQNYQGRAEGHRVNKPKAEEGQTMKREDITRIFEGATKEQIDQLLDINSADIGKAKGGAEKLQTELDAANEALKKAQETISGLEAAKGDVDKLQKQIDAYKAADEQRVKEAEAAQERAEIMERMNAVLGERKFVHDRMRDLVAEDFKAALADKQWRGKGDKEIFDAITKDQGYFANQNRAQANMPHMGHVEPTKVTDRDSFFKLSFAEQAAFKQEYPTEFNQIFHAPTP